ncbi:MAG TPA: nucleoside monophosphate kinase [Acidobacteriaceae bacterium]|nr:nucleoside monophosphate kinase [Acidobacteriaceae bacterium]
MSTPGPILLLGAPGAGKGTQAQALMTQWCIPQISTGDLLRSLRQDPARSFSPLAQQIREVMDAGRLVPDELVQAMVLERLSFPDTARGYVLDGFPRTLAQATWLDETLAESEQTLPVVAVSIRVSYNDVLRRVTGRRTCPVCGRIYNTFFNPPLSDLTCDADGTALVHRADDTVEVFSERMRTYRELTAPVVAHYRAQERFAEVDGDLPVAEVTRAISDAILELRK